MNDTMLRMTGQVLLEAAAAGDKPRRLSILAYNGGEMTVDGFGPVIIALDGLKPLPPSVPILGDHENKLSSIIASGTPTIAGGTLTVRATLADGPAADQVMKLLASGVALQASVGAQPLARRYIAAGETVQANGKTFKSGARGLLLVERATLKEVSIVAVGADDSTSVAIAAKHGTESTMSDTLTLTPEQIRTAERQRIALIEKTCSGLGDLQATLQERLRAARTDCLEGQLSLESLQAVALDCLRANRPIVSPFTSGRGASYASGPDHLAAALMVRAGFSEAAEKAYGEHVMEQSKRLHSSSLMDLCKAALQIDGRDCPSSRDAMIRAGLSTGSLPIALGSSMNRTIAVAFLEAPATWKSFCTIKPAADFRDQNSIRPSFATPLEEVGPGGEVKHASYSEETYTWSIDTFARQIQISRKSIINDDIGVFAEIIPAMGRAAARGVTNLVYSTLLSGWSTFWTSARLNYITGATTTLLADGVGLQLGLTELRKLKDADGTYLGLTPHCLLVPQGLERAARELLSSANIQRTSSDSGPTGNIFENLAQLEVEPRLSDTSYTGYSTTAWWLFSNPVNGALIVGFLDGQQTPQVESFGLDHDINTLAYGWRVVLDYGVALGDFRSSIRSKGAA